jgi:beta-lactamase superfamily II metal-dependent hydrolase
MSKIKSFSVGDGDMFYIRHNTDNFTVIDCCLYYKDDVANDIINEIKRECSDKNITRFISTHSDDDHISGLVDFKKKVGINNFYCVDNEATKKTTNDKAQKDFDCYCELRDGDKAFYLYKGCKRKWMNMSDDQRKSAGLHCLWPETDNDFFKSALKKAKDGESPNNISPAIRYSVDKSGSFLWLGDMETDMQEKMYLSQDFDSVTVLFAPHHGRDSGHVPAELLKELQPQLIIIGEAPSKNLNYYQGYNTITQNTAGDILFDAVDGFVHVYVSNDDYDTEAGLTTKTHNEVEGMNYLGSITIQKGEKNEKS